MISADLAVRLREAGLPWAPASGDRFLIPERDLDGQVFVISEMTIESQQLATGGIVRFNGTTEWALDSVAQSEVVWLPHEAQLRSLLGTSFVRLEQVDGRFLVEVRSPSYDARTAGAVERHEDSDAECAYARALLARLGAEPVTPAR